MSGSGLISIRHRGRFFEFTPEQFVDYLRGLATGSDAEDDQLNQMAAIRRRAAPAGRHNHRGHAA
jgi:hypothetical protein